MTLHVCDETNQRLHRPALRSDLFGMVTEGKRRPVFEKPLSLWNAPMDICEFRSRGCPYGTTIPSVVAIAEHTRHSFKAMFLAVLSILGLSLHS